MLLDRYAPGTFSSFEDFQANFRIHVPENFNFAYDVVDALAAARPDQPALVWCDDKGRQASFTFAELKRCSDKAANVLQAAGIGKGDPVMLILKRRYEFWFCILALHKLGAIAIPATHLLTEKDIVYRNNAAGVKMIVAVDEPGVVEAIDQARAESPTLTGAALIGGAEAGCLDFSAALQGAPEVFARPTGAQASRQRRHHAALLHLRHHGLAQDGAAQLHLSAGAHPHREATGRTSGTGGLHLTVADTGWAKSAWGKIYGQWLAAAPSSSTTTTSSCRRNCSR